MSRATRLGRTAADAFSPSSGCLFSGSSFDATFSVGREETGLYGFQVLKTAKGFRRFVDEAIEIAGELVSSISLMPPYEDVVKAMDEISNTVCAVIDSAELCRITPDREFVEEAKKACMRISEYLHFLNTNYTLYNAVLMADQKDQYNQKKLKGLLIAYGLTLKGAVFISLLRSWNELTN